MFLDKAFLHRFDRNIIGKFSYLPSRIKSMKVSLANHLLLVDSHLPCDMFNILCCNGATERSFICKSIDHFRSKKLPYAFWIGFENEPTWIEAELQKLGLITDEMEWAMACDLTLYQEQVDHSTIKKIYTREGIQDLVHVMKKIFSPEEHNAIESFYSQSEASLLLEDSQLTFFVGYEGVKPVSLASVYFDEEIASIFDVIVLPEMRGKGLGKLMTQRGMVEAKSKGIDRCILTATNDAKYLYHKLGFVDVKTMKVYHEPS
jgi:ribosomal protein S18 acetylase RimI-like enzyme